MKKGELLSTDTTSCEPFRPLAPNSALPAAGSLAELLGAKLMADFRALQIQLKPQFTQPSSSAFLPKPHFSAKHHRPERFTQALFLGQAFWCRTVPHERILCHNGCALQGLISARANHPPLLCDINVWIAAFCSPWRSTFRATAISLTRFHAYCFHCASLTRPVGSAVLSEHFLGPAHISSRPGSLRQKQRAHLWRLHSK